VALIRALFTVLRMTTIDMREIEDESELGHRAKYAELVMKVRLRVFTLLIISVANVAWGSIILSSACGKFLRQQKNLWKTGH
jgi:hypothetical protein